MGSIIIALPRQETARKIKEILLRHGFGDTIVVSTAGSGASGNRASFPRNCDQRDEASGYGLYRFAGLPATVF